MKMRPDLAEADLEAGALLTMTALSAASMTALGFEIFQKLVKSARVGQFASRFSPSPCGSPNRSYLASNGDVDASPRLRRWDDHEIARLRRMYAPPCSWSLAFLGMFAPK